jgi:hypothetical protein
MNWKKRYAKRRLQCNLGYGKTKNPKKIRLFLDKTENKNELWEWICGCSPSK